VPQLSLQDCVFTDVSLISETWPSDSSATVDVLNWIEWIIIMKCYEIALAFQASLHHGRNSLECFCLKFTCDIGTMNLAFHRNDF